jgi:hypothetical protein
MIEWLKNKWQRHNDRLALKNAFQIAHCTYPNISLSNRIILTDTLRDLVGEYQMTWGDEDGVAKFYLNRINYFILAYYQR